MPTPEPPATPHVERVLLVDDEQDILESLKTLLENAVPNVTCLTAESGAKALEILHQGPVDLIISDFKMPGMNGLAFLEQARTLMPDVPRIMITAFPHLEVAVAAINEARVEIFLTKPMDPDKFINVVRDTLQARIARRARPG
ncbi:MAG: response regulator [Thermoplasmatota archaeon]